MLTVADLGLPASKKITEANTIWSARQAIQPDQGIGLKEAEDLLVRAAIAANASYAALSPKAYALLPEDGQRILRLVIA